MRMVFWAVLISASAEAASFTTSALVGLGDTVLQYDSFAGTIGDPGVSDGVSVAVDHAPGGYDWGWSALSASRSSFFGEVETASSRDTWDTEGTFAESDIYWLSDPLLVTSSYSGAGSIILDALCGQSDYGQCESSAGGSGATAMQIQFNEPTRIWFRLNARSVGMESDVNSRAYASFSGALLGAFDADGQAIDFQYAYLLDTGISDVGTPEPAALLLIFSGLTALVLGRRLKAARMGRRTPR